MNKKINLGLGSPALPAPALAKARFWSVMNEDGGLGYAPGNGVQEARETVVWWFDHQFGVRGLDPGKDYDGSPTSLGNVTFAEGSRLLLVAAIEACFQAGDEVGLASRCYNGHWDAVLKFGLRPVFVPSSSAVEYVARLEELLRSGWRPKAVIPPCGNPNWVVCGTKEYYKLVLLAKEYEFLVLDDYAYGALDYQHGYVPCSLAIPGALDVVLWFGTASKMFSAASWKVGFAVGRQDRIALLTRAKSIYSEGGSFPGQLAMATGLRYCAADVTCTREVYRHRAELTTSLLLKAGLTGDVAGGGMFEWKQVPDGYEGGSFRLVSELRARGVIVRDDRIYGGNGKHIRWCLRVPDEETLYACEQVADLLQKG